MAVTSRKGHAKTKEAGQPQDESEKDSEAPQRRGRRPCHPRSTASAWSRAPRPISRKGKARPQEEEGGEA